MYSPDKYINSEQCRAEVTALIEGVNSALLCNNFRDAAKAIFNSCKKLIGAECGYVALLSDDHKENQALYLDPGMASCTVDPTLPMLIRGMREMTYQSGKVIIDNDFQTSASHRFMPAGHSILNNVLFAPLKIDGVAVGLLGLANKPGGFNENDIRLATAFGELAALALQRSENLEVLAEREQELQHLVQHEVVERKRAEELYRLLFSGGNDSIYVYQFQNGQPGKMLEVNDRGVRSLGYTKEELLDMPIWGFVDNEILSSKAWEVFWRSLAINGHALIESIHVTKTGRKIAVEVNAHIIEHEGNSLIIAIARDVTARKKAEYELKRQLDFEKLIGLISARFINGDIKQVDEYIEISLQEISTFLIVDRSFVYRIAENREEAVLSHSWSCPGDFFDFPKTVNLLTSPDTEWIRRLEKGEPTDIDEAETAPDNKVPLAALGIKLGLIAPMICDGKLVGIMGYSHAGEAKERNARKTALFQMIGEIFASAIRRKLELERLEKSEASSRALLRSVPDILFRVNREGFLIDYRFTSGRQRPLWNSVQALPDPLSAQVMEKIQAAICTNEVQYLEYDLQLDDGSLLSEEARITSLNNSEVLFIVRDITEAKLARQRTEEAELKMVKAKKLASLGIMATGIAHEINQPLNSIKLTASAALYLQEIGAYPCVDELMDEFGKISSEADRIAEVMTSVKALVQNNAIVVPTDVNAAIESSLKLMAPTLQSANVVIEKRLSSYNLCILGGFPQLEQVVTNLIKNAVQVLEQTEAMPKCIDIVTSSRNNLVDIEISDNGGGINPQDFDRLFDPFFSTKPETDNMGLGLPIVQSIVSSWNGKIDVYNNSSGGATFRLELPVYQEEDIDNANPSR